MILYQFILLLFPSINDRFVNRVGNWIILAGFAYYTFGLGLRWYVAGHAPWSNGYESMIFIGWAILFASLFWMRRSSWMLPIASAFSGLVLMVAHLSWMNPEITNLVPVLQSYWLTLHVSVITAGYGFLALGALLGFLTLITMSLRNNRNFKRLQLTIDELTAINEMSLTVGLYLMTIGSFLGGIWANESWGRYWGWDAKETWSLITIIVYALVLHLRLIPGWKGKLTYNIASVVSIASVIMTYLGVNYYLSGLHSYGSGDVMPFPKFAYYAIAVVFVLFILAWRKEGEIIKVYKSDINGKLKIILSDGKKLLNTPNTNYSYGTLVDVLEYGLDLIPVSNAKSILLLGMGGGSIIGSLREKYNYNGHITAVELDPLVVDIAKKEFDVDSDEMLDIICIDAWDYAEKYDDTFDLIIIDIFIDITVPKKFYDPKFWQMLEKNVNTNGFVLFNAGIDMTEEEVREFVSTLPDNFIYQKNFNVLVTNTVVIMQKIF